MQTRLLLSTLAMAGALGAWVSFATPAAAQGAQQTVAPTQVDISKIATGYRATKIVGSTVVNQNNDKIGTVDDLIVEPGEKVPYAILSVGGFLGIGDRLVAVPFNLLNFVGDKIELPGATKDELSSMAEFKYAKK